MKKNNSAACFVITGIFLLLITGLSAREKTTEESQEAGVELQPVKKETVQDRESRMAWWRESRFGLFIHWGLYTIPAGEWKGETRHAEWILTTAQIPVKEYEKFTSRFNPAEWVKAAMDATPFKRDIMKELADECHKQGIKMCWYHSIMDWHHPDYLPRRDWETRSAEGADFDRYVEYLKGQVKELLTNYGEIGVMWFDGEWESTWTRDRGIDLYNYVRSLAPDVIINNRVGKGRAGMAGTYDPETASGDFGTPEQEIPATGLDYDWETCQRLDPEAGGYRQQGGKFFIECRTHC